MKISIIIPNYNGGRTIKKTIESIYSSNKLNKHNIEIIVVDDFSKDDSIERIKKFPTVKIIQQKENKGAAAARNKGIKNAKGDYLIFIDSDAWFNRSTLEILLKNIDKETDILFPKLSYEDGHILYPILDIEKTYPHISGCFLIKKDSLKKLDEYFDEHYKQYLEDYDFFIRCKLAGLKAKYIGDAVVIHVNKDKKTDFSYRYFLEIQNTIYGILKLGKLAKKSKLYNPFRFSIYLKNIFYGGMNYAWFNWYRNNRENGKNKLKYILKKKNKISDENFFLKYTTKAKLNNIKNIGKIMKKRRSVRKFYKKTNYL